MAIALWESRRGIFYSLTALILLGFLMYALSTSTRYTYHQEMFVAKNRVQAMNTLLEDLERDMQRAVYITGFRTLLAMQQELVAENEFFHDSEAIFMEAFTEGTIYGEEAGLMANSTFPNWTAKMRQQAEKGRLDLQFEIKNVTLSQQDPWDVRVKVTSRIILTDNLGTAKWDIVKTVTGDVSIIGLEDPLYLVNSGGKVTNTFRPSPYEGNFTDGADTTNLKAHVNASYYIASASAPSYLMRLEGDLSESPAGVESLVNLLEFHAQGLSTKDRSAVDYIYFGTVDLSGDTFKIQGTHESWFRLDNTSSHLETYQVTDLAFQ